MRCHHFEAGTCRSCTLLDVPHDRQVTDAERHVRALLAPAVAGSANDVWAPPVRSADARFRNRAKMVVTGTANEPVLAMPEQRTDPDLPREDLSDCPLYPEGVDALLGSARALIRRAQVPPYDVARRRGEIKNVLVTVAPDGRAMLRLVLRSDRALGRIREHLPALLAAHPEVAVVTANLHPEHTAAIEGDEEIPLAGEAFLPMTMGPVTVHARPGSFVQTNSAVAGELYAQAGAWVDAIEGERRRDGDRWPLRIWDLYCGVGGFAMTCAQTSGFPREVTGAELSEPAIVSAREAAAAAGLDIAFHTADATTWAVAKSAAAGAPDVVIVNPPRRGIGPELAAWLERSGVPDVIYSSCNPQTLATDLAAMPSLRIARARLVDMFPHTRHDEVIVHLRRTPTDERSTP